MLAAAAFALGGCSDADEACVTNCPDLSGRYAIEESVPQGDCDFTPYLVAPTLVLQQPAASGQLSAELIDPTTQLTVLLSGRVLKLSGDADAVGSFQLDARVGRLATRNSDRMVTLDLAMNGTVLRVDDAAGEERLTGQLTTTQLEPAEGQGCQITTMVIGTRI